MGRSRIRHACWETPGRRSRIRQACWETPGRRSRIRRACWETPVRRSKIRRACWESPVGRPKIRRACGETPVSRPKIRHEWGRLGNPRANFAESRSRLWPAAPAGGAAVPTFDPTAGSLRVHRCRLPPGSSWDLPPCGSLPVPSPQASGHWSRREPDGPEVCTLVRSHGGGILT